MTATADFKQVAQYIGLAICTLIMRIVLWVSGILWGIVREIVNGVFRVAIGIIVAILSTIALFGFILWLFTLNLTDSDMKTTDHFKRTIQMYLEQRAAEDALFAKNYRNPAKNIDDCVTYILNYVQKSGCNGFTDGEIYGQAVHYYDENEIEVGKPIQCQIAVNHVVELTTEEKAEARQKALRQYQEEEVRKLQNRNKPRTATKATTQEVQQPSLFDLGL